MKFKMIHENYNVRDLDASLKLFLSTSTLIWLRTIIIPSCFAINGYFHAFNALRFNAHHFDEF